MKWTLSTIEQVLLTTGDKFLLNFFSSWDPATIILLGQTGSVLRGIVRQYHLEVWDIRRFLHRYFIDAVRFGRQLRKGQGLIFGPTVLAFFDRTFTGISPLDVCSTYIGVVPIARGLIDDGYTYQSALDDNRTFIKVVADFTRVVPDEEKMNGCERNVDIIAQDSVVLRFERPTYYAHTVFRQMVILHVTRCEPFRYILSQESSA